MKRNKDFRDALGQPDNYFRQSVINTLDQLNRQAQKESRPQRRINTRIICSFAALVLLITGSVLAGRHLTVLPGESRVDAIRPTPMVAASPADTAAGTAAAQPTLTPPEALQVIETEQAVMTVRRAVTDGYGVFIAVEVVPKDKNTLVLYDGADPFGFPDEIGAAMDFNGQSLYQWPAKHGYTKILQVSFRSYLQGITLLSSEWNKNRNSGFTAHGSDTVEDGKAMVLVSGCALPDQDAYDLEWQLVPCSVSALTADRKDLENALDFEQYESGNFRVPVTSTGETPRLLARYKSTEASGLEPGDEITATCLATSLSQYLEVRVRGSKAEGVYEISPSIEGSAGMNFAFCGIWKDGDSAVYRSTRRFDTGCPETFSLTFAVQDDAPPSPVQLERDYTTNVITSSLASLKFLSAEKSGSDTRFTVEIQPKHESTVGLTAEYLPGSALKGTAEFYGIEPDPENPDQTLYGWVTARGYQNALAVHISSPQLSSRESGPVPDACHIESCLVREDGSAVMTFTAPAGFGQACDLHWAVVPWNMEDPQGSFRPELAEHGFFQLKAVGENYIEVASIRNSAEKILGSLALRNTVTEENKFTADLEAAPVHPDSLFLDPFVQAGTDSPEKIGKTPDYEGQTILQWAGEHGCPELIQVLELGFAPDYAASPDIPSSFLAAGENLRAEYREDGSVLFGSFSCDLPAGTAGNYYAYVIIKELSKAYTPDGVEEGGEKVIPETAFLVPVPFPEQDAQP